MIKFRPDTFLCRENQFCSICYSGNPRVMVRIANWANFPEMRSQFGLVVAMRKFKSARRTAARKHLQEAHPEISLR